VPTVRRRDPRRRPHLVGDAGRPDLHAIYDDTQLDWDDTVDAAA